MITYGLYTFTTTFTQRTTYTGPINVMFAPSLRCMVGVGTTVKNALVLGNINMDQDTDAGSGTLLLFMSVTPWQLFRKVAQRTTYTGPHDAMFCANNTVYATVAGNQANQANDRASLNRDLSWSNSLTIRQESAPVPSSRKSMCAKINTEFQGTRKCK